MKKIIFAVILFLFPGICFASQNSNRGLFVSMIDKELALSSRESIDELIRFAKDAHIQTLFVEMTRLL